ncbi:MAG: PTS sugar transporter subunit IIA [Phycisphaerae bacterium]
MPYRNMTLAELAQHIGMDTREVKRLADRGVLPGRLIGGEWRFNRAQMLDWLQREMHSLDPRHIQNLDRAMSRTDDEAIINHLLATEAIDMNLPAKSRPSVLRELASLAERTGMVYDRAAVIGALEQREALASTALPGGLAFPHPRRPLPYATAEPMVCLARVPTGIPFGAPDGHLTDLFVLVCCHDERQHLLALARLALVFNSNLPNELREAEDAEEALEIVLDTERQMLRKRG